ncbi:hypothetical protein R6G99_09140, partial [Actinotignum timonense]|nr:hypothetical protein [Actinotignum timonense]
KKTETRQRDMNDNEHRACTPQPPAQAVRIVSATSLSCWVRVTSAAVREAREELARLLDGALTEVTEVFLSQLGDVELGSGRTLRLRAVEFKDRF